MQAEIAKTQAELDALKEALAHEKMEKASAQADLEAFKSKKPDTSEADALRKELQTLKDQHQAALMTAQQESAKATEEHLATKASLEKAQAELVRKKTESDSNYQDLYDSTTQLVGEANKKAADLEARLKEAEANLKVKDAELTEAKVRRQLATARINHRMRLMSTTQTKNAASPSPKTPTIAKGLAASKYADDVDAAPANSEAVEGEHDSSSAALASVRQPSPNLVFL